MPDNRRKKFQASLASSPTTVSLRVPGGKYNDEDPFPYVLQIGDVYDGPLDVLLALIKEQDLKIYDLPVAQITKQFLAYARQLSVDEVDSAGEFVHMAAQLIFIKSQMLLPIDRATAGGKAPEDPRLGLVERLLQYEQVKQATEMLRQMHFAEASSWTNPGTRELRDEGERPEPVPTKPVDAIDLGSILRQIQDQAENRQTLRVANDVVTAAQMIDYLRQRLEIEVAPISLTEAIGRSSSPRIITAAVVALLEMVRVGAVLLRQDSQFGNIRIKKTDEFEQAMRTANSLDHWT